VSFFEDVFNTNFSTKLTQAPIIFNAQLREFQATCNYFNLPAVLIVMSITLVLIFGMKESARFNAVAVVVKMFIVLLFIFACVGYINTANYHPWIPPSEGGSKYGVMGIFTGATTVFFAYIGFDAVSTAAQEARSPQRDVPIGILLSLMICTVLYIATATVLTGIANYSTLDTAAPLTDAIRNNLHWRWLAIIIEIGAIAGLTSVLLVAIMGRSRIFFAMANDGLFPPFVAKIHPKYKTPHITTLITGCLCALAGGVLPINMLGEMSSIIMLFAYFLSNIDVMVLRKLQPDAPRKFKIPGGVIGGYMIPGNQ
jgi:APA family basic amino acid/polyamine antiporter